MTSLQKLQDNLEGDKAFWGEILDAGINKVLNYSELFVEVSAYVLQ